MPSSLRLAIFDWNGTITEREADRALFQAALREMYRVYGADPPVPRGSMLHYTEVLEDFADRKIGARPRDLDRIREEYIIARWHPGLIRPEVYEVMEYFYDHCIPCAIVSGENAAILHHGLYASQLDRFMSTVEADVYVRGDDKVPFLRSVLDDFSVLATQAFFVDDTYDGVMDAHTAGLQSVAILGGFDTAEHLLAAEPRYLIGQLTGLKTIWDL